MSAYHGYGTVWLIEPSRTEVLLAETATYTVTVTGDHAVRMDSRGGPLYEADVAVVSQSGSVSLVSTDVSVDTIARLFGATAQTKSQAGGVTTYSGRPADSWVTLDDVPRAMDSITCTYAQPATQGTDYEVDLATGRVHTITGGLGALSVTWSPSGPVRWVPHERSVVRCGLRLIGENRGCGGPLDVTIDDCALSPAGPLELKGAWASVALEARVLGRSMRVSTR